MPLRSVAQPGSALGLGPRCRRFESSRSDHIKTSVGLTGRRFFLFAKREFEAERALTECQMSSQGWLRQRAQGSQRRFEHDVQTVVGESSRSDHIKTSVGLTGQRFFLFAKRGFEAERALTEYQMSSQGWLRQRAQGSQRRFEHDVQTVVGESSRSDHIKTSVGLTGRRFFLFAERGSEAERALTECQKSSQGWLLAQVR